MSIEELPSALPKLTAAVLLDSAYIKSGHSSPRSVQEVVPEATAALKSGHRAPLGPRQEPMAPGSSSEHVTIAEQHSLPEHLDAPPSWHQYHDEALRFPDMFPGSDVGTTVQEGSTSKERASSVSLPVSRSTPSHDVSDATFASLPQAPLFLLSFI